MIMKRYTFNVLVLREVCREEYFNYERKRTIS